MLINSAGYRGSNRPRGGASGCNPSGAVELIELIELIERALAAAAPDDFHRLDANREGLRAAEEAGLPVVAKRFADAIAIKETEGDPDED